MATIALILIVLYAVLFIFYKTYVFFAIESRLNSIVRSSSLEESLRCYEFLCASSSGLYSYESLQLLKKLANDKVPYDYQT